MLFKSIFKIIGRHIDLKPHKPPVLGRWCLHYESLAHRKADMTNEDHSLYTNSLSNIEELIQRIKEGNLEESISKIKVIVPEWKKSSTFEISK